MMAARAGASQVATVERIGDMVECATRVLASNGFSGKIKVVHGSSLDLEPAALGFNVMRAPQLYCRRYSTTVF